MTPPITVGVSACLLGEQVRYDGGHKLDLNIIDLLGEYFRFTPVCPEVGCGLPVPREVMRLEGDPAAPRLMTCHTRIDKTEEMLAYCSARASKLEREEVCGFIFKERSPSCGLAYVPLHCYGLAEMFTAGLFASEIVQRFPALPLEEAERLSGPRVRKNFIEQVILYHRKKYLHKVNQSMTISPRKAEQ